jgi:hypothetical protein
MTEDWRHIDDAFRSAASETKAPEFDPSYWKEFEQLLDEQNRKRGGLIWASFLGSIGLFGLIAAMFALNTVDSLYSLQFADFSQATFLYTESSNELTSANNLASSSLVRTGTLQSQQIETASLPDADGVLLSNGNVLQAQHDLSFTKTVLPVHMGTQLASNSALDNIDIGTFAMPSTQSKSAISFDIFAGLGMGQAHSGDGYSSLMSFGIRGEKVWDKLGLAIGLGIQKQNNPGLEISQRSMVYDFGVTSFENRLSYKSFTEIIVPIELNYTSKAGKIGLGIQPRIMNQSKMEYTALEDNVAQSNEMLFGRTAGINVLDADIFLTYTKPISQNLEIGMKVSQAVSGRVSQPDLFSQQLNNRPIQAQVTLTYNLGK